MRPSRQFTAVSYKGDEAMMRPFGQAGLALLVALTACALTAGSASAAHFEPAKVNFTTTSGASVFYANASPSIKCNSDKGTGGVTSCVCCRPCLSQNSSSS